MKANETKFQPLIEGTKQYLVPLFQRPYSWEKRHWQTLWRDLHDLALDNDSKSHFMGAIVTMPAHTVPEGVTKYLLIDGQQRLSTLFLLLIALRDRAKAFPGTLADKIHELYLTNKYQEDEDSYKLLPTQADRASFISHVKGNPPNDEGRISEAYRYFSKLLAAEPQEKLEALLNLIIGRLVFVSIVLANDDNAYLIFESLNFKGMPLTQADLIRNYFLMKIHVKKQEPVFNDYWLPMQFSLGESQEEFVRHYLMMKGQDFVKKNEVYSSLKAITEAYSEDQIVAYLKDLSAYSKVYLTIIKPENEKQLAIRKRLAALARAEVTTAYPFLLALYSQFQSGGCSEADLVTILHMVESFLIRRYICGVPTHGLNKFFPTLLTQAKAYPTVVEGIQEVLRKHDFPTDVEFVSDLTSRKMYGTGERLAKTRYILERLEESFGHKEGVPFKGLEIEHIMPQTLTDDWRKQLGEKWKEIHERHLDTLRNLTLTGYNPDLSNSSFDKKKSIYADSHIEMTKKLAGCPSWSEAEMTSRGDTLAKMAVSIWPYFGEQPKKSVPARKVRKEKPSGEPAMSSSDLIAFLGGGTLSHSKRVCRLHDGKVILITRSKFHPKHQCYWYGISETSLRTIEKHDCTHVAFGMGTSTVALVPCDIVKGAIGYCGISYYPNGVLHHYHFKITSGDAPEMFFLENMPKIAMTPYLIRAGSPSATLT